jgi:hypothetical protein
MNDYHATLNKKTTFLQAEKKKKQHVTLYITVHNVFCPLKHKYLTDRHMVGESKPDRLPTIKLQC